MADVAKIDEQIEKLKKRKRRLLQRENAAQRKRDTRAKIILGGAVVAVLKKDQETGRSILRHLQTVMNERDRGTLKDWFSQQDGL